MGKSALLGALLYASAPAIAQAPTSTQAASTQAFSFKTAFAAPQPDVLGTLEREVRAKNDDYATWTAQDLFAQRMLAYVRKDAVRAEWEELRKKGITVNTKYFLVDYAQNTHLATNQQRPIELGSRLRKRSIDSIIWHTTEGGSGESSAHLLSVGDALKKKMTAQQILAGSYTRKDKTRYGGNIHYVIGESGTLYPIVDTHFYAGHVGESMWAGKDHISENSIGVEIVACVEPKGKLKYEPITKEQYATARKLREFLMQHHSILYNLGHSQVACTKLVTKRRGVEHVILIRGEKGDPGKDFDWSALGLENMYAKIDPDILEGRVLPCPKKERAVIGQLVASSLQKNTATPVTNTTAVASLKTTSTRSRKTGKTARHAKAVRAERS